jgi:hypothetical protein
MKAIRHLHHLVVGCLLLALTFSTLGAAPGRAQAARADVPAGLSAADWAQVKALLPTTAVPIQQQAYLKASNTGRTDSFGWPVAISGNTVVVGAPNEDSNATGVNGNQADNSAGSAGAAYVFTRNGGVWRQQAYLKASNTGTGYAFGASVAISGDTVVVGSYGEDSNATGVNGNQADNSALDSGAAYVFTRSGGVWSQQAYLKASNTGSYDNFGKSVAISVDTVVVGAPHESSNAAGVDGDQTDNSAEQSGAAYVFTRSGGVWSQTAYLKASNTDAHDIFGSSVAIYVDTVVVAAPNESSSAAGVDGDQADNSVGYAGAAYVFTRSSGVWSQQAYLKASNPDANDAFGYSVAIDGNTLVVGACGEDSNATGVDGDGADNSAGVSGAAYVFTRSGSTWIQQAYLKASNTDAGDNFGFSVAISGDTLVVGAFNEASNATGVNGDQADNSLGYATGAAYNFTRSSGVWSQQSYLKASNTGEGDFFGYSVAIYGDTVVVGALGENSNATGVNGNQLDNSADSAGAAYVFVTPPVTISGTITGQSYAPNLKLTYTVGVQPMTFVVPPTRKYSITVPYGWSGTVIPKCPSGGFYSIWHCYFTPPLRIYNNVVTNQTLQNYQLLIAH